MKKILGAAIGDCVHVGGLHHFLKIAESEGYQSVSLGPAVSLDRLADEIRRQHPDLVAISYRLTPEVAASLFAELKAILPEQGKKNFRMVFGGTPPVAEAAKRSGLFEKTFSGAESIEEIVSYLQGTESTLSGEYFAPDLLGRIGQKQPYPLIRHHFGRPTMQETLEGVEAIAKARVVDVISLGPDQNAQEHFFHPGRMDPLRNGAGGVPLRSVQDLSDLYARSRCGNFPLMRCYAGTNDLLEWAEMSVRTIHNAWAAIPLTWYSVLDGRSERPLATAIAENQQVMRWYALQGIPVEVNESHQWSLRDSHDSLAVAMAYLASYNAKKMGVRHYIAQFMFNTPPGTTPVMDLAKMLAKWELMSELQDDDFVILREVRPGIAHFSHVPTIAKGQLAASALISMTLKPHILHVVGFSEGDHAILPGELIESCHIVHGVLQNCLNGLPDMTIDKTVIRRKEELKKEALILLGELKRLGTKSDDPLADPHNLAKAIQTGVLDTPHFKGNPHLKGDILTRLINGGWYAVDRKTGEPVGEKERLSGE